MKYKVHFPLVIIFLTVVFFISHSPATTVALNYPHQFGYQPPYAKWGTIAMQQVKSKYPNAKIIDYHYVGRFDKEYPVSSQVFKLWLKEGDKEFGVLVVLTFNRENDTLTEVEMKKTT